MESLKIRKEFLGFFNAKAHKIVASAPMVLKDDPTLMFTNAGMNQFKAFFLGNNVPKDKRIANTQKCLRVSGKHNDLEEVGLDTYHHTMFEMLGNWSFGDYFKEEAIQWAWELLTEVFNIEKDRLYVSVFEGAKDDNLPMDKQAYDLWKSMVPEDRIVMGSKKDNFWEMGEQGPCGPCSEIHVDIRSDEERKKTSGFDLVNKDHPQVVEIWNLVFIQFNRKSNGDLEKLPAQHIDTGMGFERLCMVLQGKKSNYDTDVFTPLIREIETITHTTYKNNQLPNEKGGEISVAIRVIADHVRAVSFSIADGQLPSNNGAGYVIRRILRRAIRYGFTFLNTKEPFIYKLVTTLCNQMGDIFPELISQKKLIQNVIKEEENSFLKTLDQGLILLDSLVNQTKGKVISGDKAFELYDTYGFPVDLTALILSEKGYELDQKGFQSELEKQRNRSRVASQISTGDWIAVNKVETEGFIGYDHLTSKVKIAKYRNIKSAKDGEIYQLVFDKTPFYAEGGGQVGDKGYLEASNGDVIYIINTKNENNEIVHFAKSFPKKPDDFFTAVVDPKQRQRTAAHHSATHLLQQALRVILGNHVEQKGSMVHSGYLRFDFSHFTKVSENELKEVEDFVNARISERLPLEEKRQVAFEEAISEGAMALFGEKYGDKVRTIRFGESIELCGGTHVENTSDIWHFKITSESAVAAGIRRVEAITGDVVKEYLTSQSNAYNEAKKTLNNPKDLTKAILDLQEENSNLKKRLENLLKDKTKNLKEDLKNEFKEINGVNFLAKKVDLNAAGLKDLSFKLGGEIKDSLVVFGAEHDGKALLACYISKSLVNQKQLNAGQIVRELGKYIGGGGGGQAFFATAGGKKPEGIAEALEQVKQFI